MNNLLLNKDINLKRSNKIEEKINSYIKDIDIEKMVKNDEEEYIIFKESSDKLILNGGNEYWIHNEQEKIDNESYEVYSTINMNSQIKIFVDSSINVEL